MHFQVFPWATGPLTLLESITEVPDWQVAKGQIVYLLTSFFFFLFSAMIAR